MLHEFNSIRDLCVFDNDFLVNVDSRILDNICMTLSCTRGDISRVRPVKAGLTNLSVLFSCKGVSYVYRHPGVGTDQIVDRRAEVSPWRFDFYDEACRIESMLREKGYLLPVDFDRLSSFMALLAAYVRADASEPVLCHNDFYGPNILVKPREMHLIDWEYAAMGDYACDLGNFIAQGSGYSVDEALGVLDVYLGRAADESQRLHCLGCTAIVAYYWYVWAIYKESQGSAMGSWLYAWYKAAKEFGEYALPAYRKREELMRPLSQDEFDELTARERVGKASPDELHRLEPYRVRRAVFLAAGFGSRMRPITLNTPKPLVRVHGKRIIDRLLDAVLAAGIEEIYIVRGYLGDAFAQLEKTYPMIRFVDNPLYASTNNISSARAAKDCFENAYVFESDLYLANPALVTKYQYRSNYLGIAADGTDDWCFDVDDAGRIVDIAKGSRVPCWQMVGLSYWTAEDGTRLAGDIDAVFEENDDAKQIFWDDVALRCRKDRYDIRVRPCSADDIIEIDSFEELQRIDSAYRIA